jgi:hypothetical protein
MGLGLSGLKGVELQKSIGQQRSNRLWKTGRAWEFIFHHCRSETEIAKLNAKISFCKLFGFTRFFDFEQ